MSEISLIAKIAEKILFKTKPSYMDSKDKICEKLSKNNSYSPKTHYFGNPNSDKVIIYLHGGGFINGFNFQHSLFCRIISRKTDSYIIAPEYPLAPSFTYEDSFKLLDKIYSDIGDCKIIFMGDSAGGGLAISYCQYLGKMNKKQPDCLIAISPWVDVSMSGKYFKNDPILGEVGLKAIGEVWSGNLNTKDYKVSPLYGNFRLPESLIFTGTNEIFYSDIAEFASKNDSKLITGEGLFHIYPMFPIPEAKNAIKLIIQEINSK